MGGRLVEGESEVLVSPILFVETSGTKAVIGPRPIARPRSCSVTTSLRLTAPRRVPNLIGVWHGAVLGNGTPVRVKGRSGGEVPTRSLLVLEQKVRAATRLLLTQTFFVRSHKSPLSFLRP
jgi:hypothetical protein